MFRWCSYCQKFLGEREPFEDFSLTHGMCSDCSVGRKNFSTPAALAKLKSLAAIQNALFSAGKSGDLNQARLAIDNVLRMGVRPIDFLFGLLQPSLYSIGEKWAQGEITIAEEHRFTSLASLIIQVAKERDQAIKATQPSAAPQVLLVNTPNNFHFLGIQLVDAFLKLHGVGTFSIFAKTTVKDLLPHLEKLKPAVLAVSIALPEQMEDVYKIAEAIRDSKGNSRVRIMVGGFPIRSGLVTSTQQDVMACRSLFELLEALNVEQQNQSAHL